MFYKFLFLSINCLSTLSKRTRFDNANIQHQKGDEYSRCARSDRKTEEFQASLHEGGLFCVFSGQF